MPVSLLNRRIFVLEPFEAVWGFEASGPEFPTQLKDADYQGHIKVDPFPCYPHDPVLVEHLVEQVEPKGIRSLPCTTPDGVELFGHIAKYHLIEIHNSLV